MNTAAAVYLLGALQALILFVLYDMRDRIARLERLQMAVHTRIQGDG